MGAECGGSDLDPGAMRFGSDGKIYFVTGMYRNNNKLGRFDPVTKTGLVHRDADARVRALRPQLGEAGHDRLRSIHR